MDSDTLKPCSVVALKLRAILPETVSREVHMNRSKLCKCRVVGSD